MAAKTFLKTALTISLFLTVLTFSTSVHAKTIYVDDDGPADFDSIQPAINDSNDGDIIIVADGIYAGPSNTNIDFKGKAIIVSSDNGPGNCIIDSQVSFTEDVRGFYFHSNEDENSMVDGFTIINGNAGYGGGIYCKESSPTIRNCRIMANEASFGGGFSCRKRSSPTIRNCIIGRNIAHTGPGISCSGSSDPAIDNCLIIGNTGVGGGGIDCLGSSPTITNSTITENEVTHYGGGVCSHSYSGPTINNSILWGNKASHGNQIALLNGTYPSTITVRYCDVEDGSAGVYVDPSSTLNWGAGNRNADPLFADVDGADNIVGTDDGNLRLLPGSPCLDAGDNSAIPPSVATDLDGNPRVTNGIVDIGAYECAHQAFLLSTKTITIQERGTVIFTVSLAMDPDGVVEVTVARKSGDPDITVESGARLMFDSSNYSHPQIVTLAAAEDTDNLNGTALMWVTTPGLVADGVRVIEVDNDEPTSSILFVDASGAGINSGSSWAEAYTQLRDAISIAARFPQVEEIRVAQGIYTPSEPYGDREVTFQLINGVSIKGGYAGFGEPDPDDRNIDLYRTILSGDLNGNDVNVQDPCDLLTEPTRAENSYHVMTGSGTDPTTVLEGFTITAGNANRRSFINPYRKHGAGMHNYEGRPTITNCTFSCNSAWSYGGGMVNFNSTPMVTNCIFRGNSSATHGGGMANSWNSSPTLINCTFSGNVARSSGGIYNNNVSNPTLTNCMFTGNSATRFEGGGMGNWHSSSPTLTNCVFRDNSAGCEAGGMFNLSGSPTVLNCTFRNNSAGCNGGGMTNCGHSTPTIINSTFTGNFADERGGGMSNREYSDAALINCTFSGNFSLDGGGMRNYGGSRPKLTNCVFWDNSNSEINGSTIIIFSDIKGGWPGEGNIDADPCFVELGYCDANGVWVEGNYHLLPGSPCIDAGDPNYIPEPNETDLDGKPRIIGCRIDIGAYEYGQLVSAEARIAPRTINLASKGNWITCYIWLPEQYNVADIEPNSVFLEDEIQPEQFSVDEQAQVATARFSREDVQPILEVGDINLTITGRLTNGTVFEAADTIKVIDKAGKN